MTSSIRRNPIVRAVAVLALALGLFAAVPATSGAANACVVDPDYANTMQLTANPATVQPGGTVTLHGTGYPSDCVLAVSIGACPAGTTIGSVTTDGQGTFSLNWAVPTDQKAGPVVFCTNVSNITVTANVTVASTSATIPPTSGGGQASALPKTGSQVMPFIGGGVLLLVVGSLLVLSSRKRSATH